MTSDYLGIRLDRLHRYVDAGKIPAPSFQLDPKNPRWDRLELDETLRRALLEQLEPPEPPRTKADTALGRRQIEWLKREPRQVGVLKASEDAHGSAAKKPGQKRRPTVS
jgi:hypothetical protein